jgi:hypothetical protein
VIKPAESAATSKVNGGAATIERVADILDREIKNVIKEWLMRVEKESDFNAYQAK